VDLPGEPLADDAELPDAEPPSNAMSGDVREAALHCRSGSPRPRLHRPSSISSSTEPSARSCAATPTVSAGRG
jgi:hypothetical protein